MKTQTIRIEETTTGNGASVRIMSGDTLLCASLPNRQMADRLVAQIVKDNNACSNRHFDAVAA